MYINKTCGCVLTESGDIKATAQIKRLFRCLYPCCLLSRTFSSCLQNVHRMAVKMAGNLLQLPACLCFHSFSIA